MTDSITILVSSPPRVATIASNHDCGASSGVVYAWAEGSRYATPFVTDTILRSPTVVTVDLHESVSAESIAGVLRANGIVDVLVGRARARYRSCRRLAWVRLPADIGYTSAVLRIS